MSDIVISVENLSKQYRLGVIGGATFREEFSRWWAKRLGRADPYVRLDQADHGNREGEHIWALRDTSFEVKRGEILGIIGRNGAGKSTLLKILSRVTAPTSGRALIRGLVGSLLEVGTGFHPELTGRENIYLNGTILGMSRKEVDSKLEEIVEFSEMGTFIDTPVKRYSSGMTVRLAFAVAAYLEPEILIIDEVLAVGDVAFQKKCLGKMESIAGQGRTVLFVSHNIGAIKSMCTRCVLLKAGRIAEHGDTNQVTTSYLRLAESRPVVDITPSMRNRGTGSVIFKSCSIFGLNGAATNSFLIGQDFYIDISLEINHVNKLYFWLIVFNAEGVPVVSSHQGDKETLMADSGEYTLRCMMDEIGLMPGNYTISAGAFDIGRTFLEWVDKCQSFEVLPAFMGGKPYDHRWGLLNQKVKWELISRHG